MLSDFCGDNCISFCLTINFFYDIESAKYILSYERIFFLVRCNLFHPFRMRLLLKCCIQPLQDFFQITEQFHDRSSHSYSSLPDQYQSEEFLHLSQIFCISRYTVTESCSCHYQKIAFTDSIVGCLCSMHSEHSCISRICSPEMLLFPSENLSPEHLPSLRIHIILCLLLIVQLHHLRNMYGFSESWIISTAFLNILLLNGLPLGYIHLDIPSHTL